MVDLVMASQEIYTKQCWEAGKAIDKMSSWGHALVNNLGASFVIKQFKGKLANLTEPNGQEVLSFTDNLLAGEPELLVALNLAKHVDS